jgi:hypothetical protein
MRRSHRWATASSALTLLLVGCGGEDPPALVGDDYFPVTVGMSWEYEDVHDAVTERLFKSMTDCAPDLTFDDCATGSPLTVQAVVQASTGSNNPEEAGSSFLIRLDDGFYRVRQEVQDAGEPEPEVVRTYSPGFFRFPRDTLTTGAEWTSEHHRCEDDSTVDPPTHVEADKSYQWLLEDIETVTVEAGTFEGAVKLRRITVGSGETKLYWFAPGVGKVLEQEVEGDTVLREERLVSYEIGAESCAL